MSPKRIIECLKNSTRDTFNTYLCHYTRVKSVPSILEYGLYSHAKLAEFEMLDEIDFLSDAQSRKTDAELGRDGYVRLTLSSRSPMAHKWGDQAALIKVNPVVLYEIPNVMFCLEYANTLTSELLPIADAYDEMDVEIISGRVAGDFKPRLDRADRYEILVPEHIPKRYIKV